MSCPVCGIDRSVPHNLVCGDRRCRSWICVECGCTFDAATGAYRKGPDAG